MMHGLANSKFNVFIRCDSFLSCTSISVNTYLVYISSY